METLAGAVPARYAPGPRGVPFIGALWDLRQDPLRFLLDVTREYGDVVRLGQLGKREMFLVSHPEAVKYVFNSRNFLKGMNLEVMRLLGNDNLAMISGDAWRPRRRLLQPLFRPKDILGFLPTMCSATESMLDRWDGVYRRGDLLDIPKEMMRLTLDIITETMFSTSIDSGDTELGDAISEVLDYIGQSLWWIPIPMAVPTPANRRFMRARNVINRVVYSIIEQRRRSGLQNDDMLSRILAARDEETGQGLTDKQVHDEVLSFFIAGHETTAAALAWTFYLLSRYPQARRTLSAEAHTVLQGGRPGADAGAKLVYTRQVIDESMRLYPPGWAQSRSPTEDDEVNGCRIPAGSIVMISSYVTHRRPDIWPNPDGFDPQRFAPENAQAHHRYAHFPFGGGPYTCIANGFAVLEAQVALSMVAQRYQVDLLPGQNIEPYPAFTLRPMHGMTAALQRIKPGDLHA